QAEDGIRDKLVTGVQTCALPIYAQPMSALGQKQTFSVQKACPLYPRKRTWPIYSMTSSARARTVGGTVRPSAFAVFRLITSSYFVGACTGRSAAFSPLRIRST